MLDLQFVFLSSMYFDTHCHLTLCEQHIPISEHINKASEEGMRYILDPGLKVSDFQDRYDKLKNYDNVYLGIALAPHHASEFVEEDLVLLESLIQKYPQKIKALAEIGLDYYYTIENKDKQHYFLHRQLEIAEKHKLPVCLHLRDTNEQQSIRAYDDIISILKDHPKVKVAVHCFSGNKQDAKNFLDLDFYLSFSGIVTFKNAKELQEIAVYCPLEKMITETDAPYLSPVPHRGKKNMCFFVKHTNEFIAQLKQIEISKLNTFFYENSCQFFGI